MRLVPLLALVVTPSALAAELAGAEPTDESVLVPLDLEQLGPIDGDTPEEVVGGRPARQGEWPDAAGIVFDGSYVGCTGTLVAPDVVLTAGHCVGGISHVMLGTTNWYRQEGAEIIPVRREVANAEGYDIAVLKLARKAKTPYRVIARDCIVEDFVEAGAKVFVVGYGATREDGNGFSTDLNHGATVIQTPHCEESRVGGIWTGCNPYISPGGEIGAGGNGVDACFGDSGGPLYLPTPEGTFLVGVTSRAYAGVPQEAPCAYGGLYTRPDAVVRWIERTADSKLPYPEACNLPPEVEAEPLVVSAGESGEVVLDVADADSDRFTYEVVEEPEHGTVSVEDGVVVYTADSGYAGEDSFVVRVADDGNPAWPASPSRGVDVPVSVEVVTCGCAHTGVGGWAGLFGLLALAGRRRR